MTMEGCHVRHKASSSTSNTGCVFDWTTHSRLETDYRVRSAGRSSYGIPNRIKDICIFLGLITFQSHELPRSAHILE